MAKAEKDMTSLHDSNNGDARATALVSMTRDEKERLTTKARTHGLSLSAFFRLAADEYINTHNW